jgi:hypothetical protein
MKKYAFFCQKKFENSSSYLAHVKKLFGKTGVFLHHIVQAISFKKRVESWNSCQAIVR